MDQRRAQRERREGGTSSAELQAALASRGHESRVAPRDRLDELLSWDSDLILAAGGDGTADFVATRMMDDDRPLAVLPLGSANNIARSLGVPDGLDALCEQASASASGSVMPFGR